MTITIDELKKLCDLILAVPEKMGISEISVDVDYYWVIFTADSHKLNKKNPRKGIGSFVDDWDSLMKVVNDCNAMSSVDCDRLGNIINIVGDEIQKSNKTGIRIITINDLKKMCKKIFSIIEGSGFGDFVMSIDRYRYIGRDEAYKIYSEKLHPQVRSLIDEWKDLKHILAGQRDAAITDFEHLGIVIKMVGHAISRTTDRVLLDLRDEEK